MTVRDFINRHAPSVTALGALGALLDARASNTPLDPTLEARLVEMLDVIGAPALADLAPRDAAQFLFELRQHIGADTTLLYPESRGTSWAYANPQLLQSAGDFSRNFARGLTANVIPALDGLAARFTAPDAKFLDVGVGVACLSIELATLWPKLRITGIDCWGPSLALARENITTAKLTDRIELREQAVEALTDDSSYALAWLPIIFIPERVMSAAIERTFHALEPGGWAVLGFANWDVPDPVQRAFWRLRTTMFGGPLWNIAEVTTFVKERNFVDVRVLPTPPGAPALLAARRPT